MRKKSYSYYYEIIGKKSADPKVLISERFAV
jgi:hypothetical protein